MAARKHLFRTRPHSARLTVSLLEDRVVPAAAWTDLATLPASPTAAAAYLHPQQYRALGIDTAEMRSILAAAPTEQAVWKGTTPLTFSLPAPNGTIQRFAVNSVDIMEPGLAAQFPDIKTYRGGGIDDPSATLAMDITPQGFHVQVLSGTTGRWMIDPYYQLETTVYISYYSSDLKISDVYESRNGVKVGNSKTPLALGDDIADGTAGRGPGGSGGDGGGTGGKGPTGGRPSGSQLRLYRAAFAGDGEYTQFQGGTVALGQAAIVTSVNRLNQVYENELSIRMVLVANNSSLVYTNPATDPYTNGDTTAMIAENQANVDTVIGNANYDIGHVFGTDSGGLAVLPSVGIDGRKAMGATGSSAPIGDPFDIDYVAHEVGHQFGANHTFNGINGAANGGRNASTAYEPGSGSTIESYSGISGADDLQVASDPYFHSANFDEILNYVDGVIPNVGTRVTTGNAIPVVNAGADYVIPTRTPFELTGSATDADGPTLTYDWQERDLGPAQALSGSDNGSSPIFRVFNPTLSPSRTFPKIGDIISGTPTKGEQMYTQARTSTYRLLVRDNRPGGGASNSDDMTLRVVDTGAAFTVTAPNTTGVSWPALSTQTVTWNVAGTTGNGINTANVRIRLSADGGLTYPITILASTPNDGTETITVPNFGTTRARIRVEAVGNVFFDISDADFTIVGIPAVTDVRSTVPDGVYQDGAIIPIVVTFGTQVVVTGTPALDLNAGSPATAFYTGGSGTNFLTFTYVVGPGDYTPDLDYTSIAALSLFGGTIRDQATNAPAILALPTPGAAGSLGFNNDIVVDAVTPALVVVSAVPTGGAATLLPPNGDIDITFNTPVDPNSISIGDFLVSQGTVTGFTFLDDPLGPTQVRINVAGLVEGPLRLTIGPSTLATTPSGLPNQSFSTTLYVDIVSAAFPLPLTSFGTLGWQSYVGTLTGVIAPETDTDDLTIPLTAGSRLTLIVTPDPALQPTVELLDPTGLSVAFAPSVAVGTEATLDSVLVPVTGLYRVRVGSVAGTPGTSGNFSVRAFLNMTREAEESGGATNDTPATGQSLDGAFAAQPNGASLVTAFGHAQGSGTALPAETEANDTIGTANDAATNFTPLASSNLYMLSINGNVSIANDQDWFRIGQLQPGDVVTISAVGLNVGGFNLPDPQLEFWGQNAGKVTEDDDSGSGPPARGDALVYRFTVTTADTYFIQARAFQGNGLGYTGRYRLGVYLENAGAPPTVGGNFTAESEAVGASTNNTLATADNASASWRLAGYQSRTAGTITAGDVDVFRYAFSAGDRVSFRVDGIAGFVPQVSLRDGAGTVMASEDGTSTDNGTSLTTSYIYSFRIAAAGSYYLSVRSSVGGGAGAYTAFVDLATNTAPPAPIGGSDDYYSFTLAAGQTASVALNRLGGTGTTVSVLDAAGTVVATGTVGATNFDAGVNYTNPGAAPATYTVRVFGPGQTDYELAVLRGGILDRESNDNVGAAGLLALNSAPLALGAITPSNTDWYTITVPAGNTLVYTFTTTTPGDSGGPYTNTFDPRLDIFGPTGILLGSDDNSAPDGRNAVVAVHLSAGGVYRVRLRGTDSATFGEYTLAVTTAVNVPPTGVTAGGPYSIPEGGSLTLSGAAADANGDQLTYTWDIQGVGTTVDAVGANPTLTWADLVALGIADGSAAGTTFQVVLKATDGFSPVVASAPVTLTVTNVAPSAAIFGSATTEGSNATVTLTNPADPSAADVAAGFRYSFSQTLAGLKTTYADAGTANSQSYLYDDNGTYPIFAHVFDKDDGFADYSFNVIVANVAPGATVSGSAPVVLGNPSSATLSNPVEPSNADRLAGFTYGFDFNNDGDFTDAGDISGSLSPTGSFAFPGPGLYTIRARISDKDATATTGFSDYTTTVQVLGATPTGTVTVSSPTREGGGALVAVTNVSSPSAPDTAAGFRYAYDFNNDGTYEVGDGTYAGSSDFTNVAVPNALTADGPFATTVRVRIVTASEGQVDLLVPLNVVNVAPTATLTTPTARLLPGNAATVAFVNSFDPSPIDTAAGFKYSFDLNNDGNFTSPGDVAGSTSPTANVTFDKPGRYTVRGRIADKNGAFTDYTAVVTISPTIQQWYATGTDVGSPSYVRLYDETGAVKFSGAAFDPSFSGGVRVAVADVTGDGTPDLVAGTGPGAVTQLVVIDGKSGAVILRTQPFEAGFQGGIFVAAGDIDGDGKADIAVSPDLGGGPRVILYSGATLAPTASFFAIDDVNFRGGARVALADLNGDGRYDLLVAAGVGGGPRVAGFDGASVFTPFRQKLFGDFFAFAPDLRNGVYIAGGDLDGDGFAEVIVGAGPGGGPRVTAFDGATLVKTNRRISKADFFAGDVTSRAGVRVAIADVDGDGRADIVTGPGFGAGGGANIYNGDGIARVGQPDSNTDLAPFASLTSGVFVG